VYGEAAPFVRFLSASRRARATPPPLPRLPLPTSGNGAGRLTTFSEMWGRPTIWPTFEYHRHPQPKIASQSDLTLSTGLAGTPVIAAMLSGLVPHDLVLRCHPRSCLKLNTYNCLAASRHSGRPRPESQLNRLPNHNPAQQFRQRQGGAAGNTLYAGRDRPGERVLSTCGDRGNGDSALSEAVHSETKKSSPGVMRAGRHSLYTTRS
jgi:hypothetical protein